MLSADNIGDIGVGAQTPQARLDVAGLDSGTALGLRSGNS